jgi:lysophospholipase L1-like esterase
VIPKPVGRYRILCLGGSATFDLLAVDDTETWPARLEHLLRHDNVDTVNAGFPGWTTVESLISLAIRDIDADPDLVVILAGVNDLQPASHEPFTRDYSRGHAELLARVLGVDPVPVRLAARLVVVERLLDIGFGGRYTTTEGYAPAWQWTGGPKRDAVPDAALEVFERNLRSTIAVAHGAGASVLLLAQHVKLAPGNQNHRDYVESWAPGLTAEGFLSGLESFNSVSRRLASEGLVHFADPIEDSGFGQPDFGDPMHLSRQGSEKLARALAEIVQDIRSRQKARAADTRTPKQRF